MIAQRVAVLGATGSIGASALDVVARHPQRLRASVLAAGSRVEPLLALCRAHAPEHAVIADDAGYAALRDGLRAAGLPTRAHAGAAALAEFAAGEHCDTVVAAIVGAAGLDSTLAAARAGKRLLLANKESLVLAGELLMQAAREGGATVVPIDSEHNAIFQCLPEACDRAATTDDTHARRDAAGREHAAGSSSARSTVRRIVLTASGGPFRGWSRERLASVTPEQAVAHPKWSMGPKISVDSASLMNKGLEVIEAHHLFGLPRARIDVLVHPQSLVHSLVEFVDGSTLAQLGLPDMRTALAVGFAWPARIASGVEPLDLARHGRLDFEPPDLDTFPCLALAFDALEAGGTAPGLLNAINEVAVESFLQRRLPFDRIPALIAEGLAALPAAPAGSIDTLLAADAAARAWARERLQGRSQASGTPRA